MCESQRASNGLYILIKMACYKANRNNGHPSYDHGLKHNTSSVDPCWLALRINPNLNLLAMQLSLRPTL